MDDHEERLAAIAAVGFSDGGTYERGRPGYPEGALSLLATVLGFGPGRRVVELGAGTGKFTRQLLSTGVDIVAVEPSGSMCVELARIMPDVALVRGRAEAVPVASASADAVVAAQAFHWFDPERSLAETRRVLHRGGGLGLIWNERDEAVPWVAELSRAIEWPERQPYPVGMDFRPVITGSPGFTDVARHRFRFRQSLSHAGVLDRLASTSYITAMPPAERAAFLAPAAELVAGLPARIELPYVTSVYTARCG